MFLFPMDYIKPNSHKAMRGLRGSKTRMGETWANKAITQRPMESYQMHSFMVNILNEGQVR